MRAALADPESQRTSDKKIVTYKGGGFTVADFLRWVYAVPPQLAQQLPGVADEQLKEFARILTQNTLLLDQADSLHIGLTPLEWASIRQQYGTEMDSLRVILGLGASLTDTSVAATERAQVAALRVDGYFSDLLTGKTRLRRIPASLSSWLRRHGEFRLNQAGLIRSVELAAVVKARADSATTRDSTRPAADSGRTQPPAGR